ncbi:MAG TPA: acetyl-CoA carboxylase biotin carboxyl carrier protein subunit [Bacteroidales bacterium]|nr:acetyl-CoA carboxylase biotin carboxyl carrier protein subunit [Bacteroidales bacterium]
MANSEGEYGKLNINHSVYQTRLSRKLREKTVYEPVDNRKIKSFIPGTVVEVKVKEGDIVSEGDVLLVLEAMKMKNRIKCSIPGTVKLINVKEGDRVPKGELLIELD